MNKFNRLTVGDYMYTGSDPSVPFVEFTPETLHVVKIDGGGGYLDPENEPTKNLWAALAGGSNELSEWVDWRVMKHAECRSLRAIDPLIPRLWPDKSCADNSAEIAAQRAIDMLWVDALCRTSQEPIDPNCWRNELLKQNPAWLRRIQRTYNLTFQII